MRTRRTVLAGVATTVTLAGCSQQRSQPAEEQTTSSSTDEFSLNDFRVDGNPPSEYDAQFIAGASPDAAADEFNPQFSYTITGTSNDVETELHVTHSPETIPKEELDETRQGETHPGEGAYQQNIALPDAVIEMFAETPRNLQATFRATDAETDQTKTQTFAMNYGNSYAEQIIEEAFNQDKVKYVENFDSVNMADKELQVEYSSTTEPGTMDFDQGLSFIGGVYTEIIDNVREPLGLELSVNYNDGEIHKGRIEQSTALKYLEGDITFGKFQTKVGVEKLPTSH